MQGRHFKYHKKILRNDYIFNIDLNKSRFLFVYTKKVHTFACQKNN